MPRFYLNLAVGESVAPDPEGLDLPSAAAARELARKTVQDLWSDPPADVQDWWLWSVLVSDEQGDLVFRLPLYAFADSRQDHRPQEPQPLA